MTSLRGALARVVVSSLLAWGCQDTGGGLRITIIDADTGLPTPARVSVVDENGKGWIAEDALAVQGDCGEGWPPRFGPSADLPDDGRTVWDPYTDTVQFYADGSARVSLPPGRYVATFHKGLEYESPRREVLVTGDGDVDLEVTMERWIDMAARGWLGTDEHLHITRDAPSADDGLLTWMQAEDLRVANLLQMGTSEGARAALQMDFGASSVAKRDDTSIVSGQENPRTHNFGHVVILGAPRYIDFPQRYLVYGEFLRAAARDGAISGYAHFGTSGAYNGLTIDVTSGLVDFLEVMALRELETRVLYEMWNLGFDITPTAGTDYPCGGVASLPGQERFYARADGAPSFESWLAGVRAGHTFVSNGPMLDLDVAGVGMGDDLRLAAPGAVEVRAKVRFDPDRDQIDVLELIQNGAVVASTTEEAKPGRMTLRARPTIRESSWLAVQAKGSKVRPGVGGVAPPSLAHSARVDVTVAGTPRLEEQPEAIALSNGSREHLDVLEKFIRRAAISEPDREGLLEAITVARRRFQERSP